MSTIEVGRISKTIERISSGVDVQHEYYNAGEKTIKYITFSYIPYNSVNDIVACTASGKTEVNGKLTGPISPKHKSYVEWRNMWFNPTVSTVVISRIHIQFMDDTEEVIDGKDVVFTDNPKSAYYRDITIPEQKEAEKRNKEAEKRKKIDSATEKMYKTATSTNDISTVLLEFKDDQEALLKIFEGVNKKIKNELKPNIKSGYLIGDYIEKEYSSNEDFMQRAVSIWKDCIAIHQKYQFLPWGSDDKSRSAAVKTYAAKIRTHEPAYVVPKKAGCVSFA